MPTQQLIESTSNPENPVSGDHNNATPPRSSEEPSGQRAVQDSVQDVGQEMPLQTEGRKQQQPEQATRISEQLSRKSNEVS